MVEGVDYICPDYWRASPLPVGHLCGGVTNRCNQLGHGRPNHDVHMKEREQCYVSRMKDRSLIYVADTFRVLFT